MSKQKKVDKPISGKISFMASIKNVQKREGVNDS
ncbi:MAG: hypothetical protein ACD_13C00044G0009 [uncultured bacterium]|nr:MAG: hypothetical protein ACD_13C00044G0009 [uncultured bacterium]